MVGEVVDVIECALKRLIDVTEESKNLRSDLKEDIRKSVSNLRKAFCDLQNQVVEKDKLINEIRDDVKKAESRTRAVMAEGNLSAGMGTLPPSVTQMRNSYASAARANQSTEKNYKLILKSKLKESAEAMKVLMKRHINPTELKVGINSFKALRDGRIIIESRKKEDIEVLSREIENQCSQQIEVNIPKLRNPNVIIFNVPDDISVDNAAAVIISQNPELNLPEGSLRPKFVFRTRKNFRNLVIEVKPESWRALVERKIKIGWQFCNVADYIKVNRYYRCSKYNHRAENCTGEETYPLCAGSHKLRDCQASRQEFKCTNCISNNKYNTDKVDEKHSSLDKNCPSMISMIDKYRKNTEY